MKQPVRSRSGKRRRRIWFIAVAALGVAVLGGGAFALRQAQLDRDARTAREEGEAALADGRFTEALDDFGRYLQRFADDGATAKDFLLYARARRRVPLPNGRHLSNAVGALRKSVERDPSNREAKSELLDVYLDAGWTTEALELVGSMLAETPGDAHLLRARRDVLEATKRNREALAVAKEVNVAAPDDVEDHFATLRLLVASGASDQDVDQWTDAAVAAHASDARFELLRAAKFTRRGDEAAAKRALDHVLAAQGEATDPAFVKLLVAELDAAGRFADSTRVIERAVDPDLRREAVRRLWYDGRLDDLATRKDVEQLAGDDPEVAALRALALEATKRPGADALRGRLAGRKDAVGAAWATFVLAQTAKPGEPPATSALVEAVAASPKSACLREALAESYASIGETDLALEAWNEAAQRAPSWAMPPRRAAETMLATGRAHLAPGPARAAARISPSDPRTLATFVRAAAAAAGRLEGKQLDAVLAAAESLRKNAPAEADETLPVFVGLVARTDKAQARRRIEEALARRTAPSEGVLLRLAQAADEADIPLSGRVYDLCESAHGATPQLALARALSRARVEGDEAGLVLLDAAKARDTSGGPALDWELVRAGYLEATRRPEAGAAWAAVADAHPDALVAQLGELASVAAWNDLEAIDRAVERAHKLTGDDAVTWRVARARRLLTPEAASESDLAEAARMLNDVTRAAPSSVAARVLLAGALEKLGNLTGAEEQLRLAADLAPDDLSIALEVARLAQSQGRAEVARRQLDRVVAAGGLAPEQAERAAFLLAVQGDQRRGADLLAPLADDGRAGRDGAVLLARLYVRLGETQRAADLCARLLEKPDAVGVAVAAEVYEALGRPADADAALALLDGVKSQAGERELVRARHAAGRGSDDDARSWFAKATEVAPARADLWTERLRQAAATGDAKTAAAVLDASRARDVPAVRFAADLRSDGVFDVVDGRARVLVVGGIDSKADRAVIADALRALRDLRGADAERRGEARRAFFALADGAVRVLPLQIVAADVALEAGDPARARGTAKRTMKEFPLSVAAARQAAGLCAASGIWEEALEAARTWRARAGGRDLAADVFVAESLVRVGRPAEGAALLEPYVAAALAARSGREEVLLAHALACLRSGDETRAAETIAVLARRAGPVRLAAPLVDSERLGDGARAVAWLDACAAAAPSDDAEARFALTRAWAAAWTRFRTPELLAKTKAALAAATARPDAPADAFVVAGSVAQETGDLDGARKAYGEALRRDPSRVDARNNLAMALADAGMPREAFAEADRAAQAAPASPVLRDTLAYTLRKGADYGRAKDALLDAIRLDPANPAWRLHLAETLAESGDADGARGAVSRVDELLARGAELDAAQRARLDDLRAKTRR